MGMTDAKEQKGADTATWMRWGVRDKDGRVVVPRRGDRVNISRMGPMSRSRIRLEVEGLTGTHAVRAAWTALAAVPGIVSAEVSMTGVVLEVEGMLDQPLLAAALDAAGVRLVGVSVEQTRALPII